MFGWPLSTGLFSHHNAADSLVVSRYLSPPSSRYLLYLLHLSHPPQLLRLVLIPSLLSLYCFLSGLGLLPGLAFLLTLTHLYQ